MMTVGLHELQFDNQFTRVLPADIEQVNSRRQVRGACFSRVLPAKVVKPQLIGYSQEVAQLLDLNSDVYTSQDFAEVFSGNQQLPVSWVMGERSTWVK